MIPYVSAFGITLFFSLSSRLHACLRSISLLWLLLFMSVFAGFFLGKDYQGYEQIFFHVPNLSTLIGNPAIFDQIYGESGYIVLQSISKVFVSEYIYFQLLVIFASISIKIYFFSRYSWFFPLAAIWYVSMFIYFDMTALRHGLAAAILLVSLLLFAKKWYFFYFLTVFVATTIHSVAFCFFLIPIAHFIIKHKVLFIATLIASVGLGIIGFAHIVMALLEGLGLDFYGTNKMLAYVGGKYDTDAGLLRGVVIKQGMILLFAYFYVRNKVRSRLFDIALASYLLSFIFLVSLNDFSLLANRTSNVLVFIECYIVTMLPLVFKKDDRPHVVIALIGLAVIQLMWMGRNLFIDYRSLLF